MGLLDRFAKRVADELNKAPNLPAGATTMSMQEMQNSAGIAAMQYGNVSNVVPRNPLFSNVPFASGMPIRPGAINPLNPETGRPDPRRYEFQVAQNINVTDNKLVPFNTSYSFLQIIQTDISTSFFK